MRALTSFALSGSLVLVLVLAAGGQASATPGTGQAEERRTFSQNDAEIAGLWSKAGPWKQYPKRMLQMRARAFCLRDLFPDVLKGLAVAEEVVDYVEIHPGHADANRDTPRTQHVTDKVMKAAEKIRKSKENPSAEQELLPWES